MEFLMAVVTLCLMISACSPVGEIKSIPLDTGVVRTFQAPFDETLAAARQAIAEVPLKMLSDEKVTDESWMLVCGLGDTYSGGVTMRVTIGRESESETSVRLYTIIYGQGWNTIVSHSTTIILESIESSLASPGGPTPAQIKEDEVEFVLVKGGTFEMGDTFGEGSGDERPVHTVTIDDFYISKTEVTFAQYDEFCDSTQREKPTHYGLAQMRGRLPVFNVSWHDAVAFCKWLSEKTGYSVRLPTEAEWEYAAREGGKKVRFGNGKDIADPKEINFRGGDSWPAIALKPNALGLYNMSGNVCEWCSDWYDKHYYKSSLSQNPQGPASGTKRVYRGGYFNSKSAHVRCSARNGTEPDKLFANIGFRVARDI